jgi:hypothetical protein
MNERTTLLHGVKLKHNAGAGSPIHPKIINILYQQVIRRKLLSPGRKFVTCSFIYSNNITNIRTVAKILYFGVGVHVQNVAVCKPERRGSNTSHYICSICKPEGRGSIDRLTTHGHRAETAIIIIITVISHKNKGM